MLRKFYLGLGTLTLMGYSALTLMGWEWTSPQRGFIPQNVRSSPGGYRSYFFVHPGFHGGK